MRGTNIVTDSSRKRMTSILIMVAGMIIYWLWEANLISSFAIPAKTLPYNNMEEFLKQSNHKVTYYNTVLLLKFSTPYLITMVNFTLVYPHIKYFVILQLIVKKGTRHEDFFRYSKDPVIQQVWKERVLPYIETDPIYKVKSTFEHLNILC